MQYFEQKKARIEIIPMIDIMLFLLVFFAMLTLKMIPTTGHTSQLPSSATAEKLPQSKIRVEVTDQGWLYIDGQRMEPGQVSEWVRLHDPSNAAVFIMGGEHVNLQQLMNAIDAVKKGGASRISLASKPA